MKRNDGFTMIELLVTVTAGALVTLAAVALLLMGTRIQHGSTTDVKEQQTVRTVLTLMEQMAGSGQIRYIENTYDGWRLWDKDAEDPDKEVVFEYIITEQTVYSGSRSAGVPLLTGLNDAGVTLENDQLLRLSFDTARGESYVTRIFCRTAKVEEDKGEDVEDAESIFEFVEDKTEALEGSVEAYRLAFLEALAGEYAGGNNTGKILNPITLEGGVPQSYDYYSEWYIGSYAANSGWNKDTPWCACFASWAAVKSGVLPASGPFKFANVDTGMAAFQNTANGGQWKTDDPKPGDYIFFDWSGEKKDPAHVGVVLDVDTVNHVLYTIEGNSSNRVSVRKYNLSEKTIMGYGVLPQFVEGIDA